MAMNEQPRRGDAADEPMDPELARLYRDSAREEPPPHLDAAIRAAARREVRARPAGLRTFFRRSWGLPISIAAVVVLCVSVVRLMVEEDEARLPAPPQSISKPLAESPRNEAPDRTGRPGPFVAAPPALPEARDRPEAASKAARQKGTVEQPAGVRQEGSAAAVAEEGGEAEAGRARASRPAVQGVAPLAQTVPPPRSDLVREYEDQPPEKWGEKIIELRQQGKPAEADELLSQFRRRFPGYPVPAKWER